MLTENLLDLLDNIDVSLNHEDVKGLTELESCFTAKGLILPVSNNVYFIPYDEIYRLERSNNKILIHTYSRQNSELLLSISDYGNATTIAILDVILDDIRKLIVKQLGGVVFTELSGIGTLITGDEEVDSLFKEDFSILDWIQVNSTPGQLITPDTQSVGPTLNRSFIRWGDITAVSAENTRPFTVSVFANETSYIVKLRNGESAELLINWITEQIRTFVK